MGFSKENGHYQWLDLLRFLAAFLVMAGHVRNTVFAAWGGLAPQSHRAFTAIFFALTSMGGESVIVFFVLSGYLVGGKAIERMISVTFDPWDYLIDRTTRIWVPLLPALALSAGIAYWEWGDTNSVLAWLGNLFGLQHVIVSPLGRNEPLWSLAYEIWFYLLAFAVGRIVLRRSLDLLSLFVMICGALVFTQLSVHYLLSWLLGALFYLKPPRMKLPLAWGLSLSVMIVALLLRKSSTDGVTEIFQGMPLLRMFSEIVLSAGMALLCTVLVQLRPNRLSKIGVTLAAFSYTLYLTHYPMLWLCGLVGWGQATTVNAMGMIRYALCLLFFSLTSWMIYWMFERNTKQVRNYIKGKLRVTPRNYARPVR